MNKFFEPTYEDNGGKVWGISELLDLVKDWEDPNPKVVIEEYDGIKVVRDDLLHHGSKIRFIDKFIKDTPAKEIVFGSCHLKVMHKYHYLLLLKNMERKLYCLYPEEILKTIMSIKKEEWI